MLAQGELSHGTFILAEFQTNGRGYGNNSWFSSSQTNLLGTLYVEFTHLPAHAQFSVTTLVSTTIAHYLEKELNQEIFVKWPNDIYVSNRKICGLLIENQIMGNFLHSSLIGMGLNVNETHFPSNLPHAVSMFQTDGKFRNINQVAQVIGSSVLYKMQNAEFEKYGLEEYLARLYRKDRVANYRRGNTIFQGIIRGIDVYGRLLLETEDGLQTFGFKEVEYIM